MFKLHVLPYNGSLIWHVLYPVNIPTHTHQHTPLSPSKDPSHSLIPTPHLLPLHRNRRRPRDDKRRDPALADVVHRRPEALCAALDVDEDRGGPSRDLGKARRRGEGVHLVGGGVHLEIGVLLGG